jgi:hypothetical protein
MALQAMKCATNSVPKKCSCGRALPRKPQYGYPWYKIDKDGFRWDNLTYWERHGRRLPRGEVWFTECSCSNRIVWGYPNVWVVRNREPLFDTKEVIG